MTIGLVLATSLGAAPWSLICVIVALILFVLASLNVGNGSKVSLGWAGCFFAVLALALR